MSYNNRYTGAITVSPPLNATEVREAPAFNDIRLRVSERVEQTEQGEVIVRSADAIEPTCNGFSGYNLTDDIRRFVEYAGAGRTFGGFIEVNWDAGFGAQPPERYVIRGGQLETITPRLVWPDTDRPKFVVYDGTRFTELYGCDEVEVFPTPAGALLGADQENAKFNGFMTGPEGRLVKAHPWKAYELVEVDPP